MPLLQDGSDESVGKNIAELLRHGHPKAQAQAIALSIQRKAKGEPERVAKGERPEAMSAEDFAKEHKRLLRVLKSPSHKDDMEEFRAQAEEVREKLTPKKAAEVIGKAENMPHPNPTEGQKRAGNYRLAHWKIHGLDISIENLAGSQREGVGEDGKPWAVTLPYHYGYIRGTEGADGDHVDCMIGPLHDKGTEVTIINQKRKGGEGFDEHKVMIGYPSREQALAAFCHGRDDDPREVMGHAITVPVEEFLRWVEEGNHQEATVLKAETVAKAEGKVHVKSHFRNVNGKIVYIPDYDKATHGDHPVATLHERTIHKQTKHGHTLQVFDSEDNEKVKSVMAQLGVKPQVSQHTGATHHGVKKSVFQHHFTDEADAQAVHDALKNEPAEKPEPTPAPGPDKGPATGPDTKAQQDQEAVDEAELSIDGIVSHFGDPEAGDGVHDFDILKTEAYANIETGLQHGASKFWAVEQEMKIRDSWKDYIFQMLPGQGKALEAMDGSSFANKIANGITTQGQMEILADIAGVAQLVAEVNAVSDPANGDGKKFGHAYKEALAMEGWASDLDQIMEKGKPKYITSALDPISATEALAKIKQDAVEVMDYFFGHHESMNKAYASGKINATKTQGYVPPAFHDIAIKSREALMAFHKAAGNDYEAQTQENLLHNAHTAKHESQKMHDYVSLDADALVSGPPPQGMTAQNAAKLAAVSFQMKAKAASATGQSAMASHYINKAKAAATVALTLAGK